MSTHKYDNDIPKIVLDKEDRDAFRQSRMKGKSKTSASKVTEEEVAKSSGGSSGVWVFVMLIALGGYGASFWLYQQVQAQNKLLSSAQQRIVDLEDRLSATDEEMGESAGAMQVRVNQLGEKTQQLWEQMDKLWASAWRRNQKEIGDLRTGLNNTKEDIQKQLTLVENEVNTGVTTMSLLQEQIERQSAENQKLTTTITSLTDNASGLSRQVKDLQSKLVATDQINSSLTRRIVALEKKTAPQANLPPANKSVDVKPITVGDPQN